MKRSNHLILTVTLVYYYKDEMAKCGRTLTMNEYGRYMNDGSMLQTRSDWVLIGVIAISHMINGAAYSSADSFLKTYYLWLGLNWWQFHNYIVQVL